MSPEHAMQIRTPKCKVDDRIAVHRIAVGEGLFPRSVRAPREGRVVAVGGGQVLMEVGESKIELRAGIPGTIIEIIPNRGAVIQTAGALVQGVWGNGRIDSGLLVNIAEKPDGMLTAGRLDVSLRGSILLASMVKDAETLQTAADLPVRGMILSSLNPSLIQTARDSVSIMVTDVLASADELRRTNCSARMPSVMTVNARYDRYSGAS